jgi:CxxC-x17-CxxC domain-containing protein
LDTVFLFIYTVYLIPDMDPLVDKEITYFARTNFRGTDQIFGIKRKDRRQHTYVLGKSGTGKSVLLENMIIQNIQNGEGVCVVDPHGELAEKILESIPAERAQDVIYFNPADTDNPMGFNVLQLDDPKYKHLVASGLMGIFTKIWANVWSSRMEYILNNAILALLDTPNTTLLGIPRLLVDKDYRQYIIGNLKDPVVKAFWVHEFEAWKEQFRNEAIAPIQNKVGQFLSSSIVRNVVGQSRSAINIFDIMNEKKILIINVSKGRIGEDNSALLGGMMITKIQLAAMERVRIPEQERKDFYLYIDEFQNFSTESFGSILSEARKYRLCLIIAHQYTAQLDETVRDAVFGNVGTMIIFRVGADDADNVEKEFSPEFTVEDFVNLPNYHIYTKLMVDGVTSRPFSARTLPPIEVHTTPEVQELVISTSRKLYTKPRVEVEAEVDRWSSTVPGGQTGPDEGDVSAGKFKVTCVNDGKVIYVPFEPKPGLPVYCKECLFKIKNGELEPLPGYRAPRDNKDVNRRDPVSYDSLALLGIEFQSAPTRPAPQPRSAAPSILNPIKSLGQKIQSAIQGPAPVRRPDVPRRDVPPQSSTAPRSAPSSPIRQNPIPQKETDVRPSPVVASPQPAPIVSQPQRPITTAPTSPRPMSSTTAPVQKKPEDRRPLPPKNICSKRKTRSRYAWATIASV